jgi:transcriptional pleiotropic regulator of transition state genes
MNLKATGMTRKLDELGRVTIPMELRKTLSINIGDPLEVFVDGEMIIFKKYSPGCTFCNSLDGLKPFGGVYVCEHCRQALKEKAL